MRYSHLDEALIRRVEPSKARFYVEAKGWVRVESKPESVAVYHHPSFEGEELVIPERSYGDFTLRISDAVVRIAETESRDPNAILSDMLLSSPADIVEVKAIERETEDGTIPLEIGMKFERGARGLLKASAHAALTSLNTPDDLLDHLTNEFLESCRIAPPERGSYVVRFMCPSGILPSMQTTLSSPIPGPSLTRMVTTALMNRVKSTITLADRPFNDSNLSEPERRVYIEFCEAISDLELRDEEAIVNLGVSWAGKNPREAKLPTDIRMWKGNFEAVRRFRESLAEEVTDERLVFTGVITSIRDVIELISPEDIKFLEVEFVYSGKERPQKAKVRLPLDEREKVFRAAHGRLTITVEGKPGKGERKTWIEDSSKFEILQ